MVIKFSVEDINKCNVFSDKVFKSTKDMYFIRGESNFKKIKYDCIIGKLGELAAYTYLNSKGFEVSEPDFKIYTSFEKSYDADLVTKCGKNIHVKSQGFKSMMRYGASWLLQKNDKITRNPTEDDYILMVSINANEADVLGVVRVLDLLENDLFEEPKVARYARTKKALYFDSIKNSGISLDSL